MLPDQKAAGNAPAQTQQDAAGYARAAEDARRHQAATGSGHVPVMLDEVLQSLGPRDGEIHVDGTFGAGGYARAILQAAGCTLYAIDRDPAAAPRARQLAEDFGGRLHFLPGCFGDVAALLQAAGVEKIDGFVLDLGISSMQIDQPARGFSFREDGPLDMRMGGSGPSAADIVNTAGEAELADIIYTYGEERASRRIAKRIVEARAEKPIATTRELAAIVHSVLPMHGGMKTDTATRTFQALRIAVNDELGELERALAAILPLLREGGRIVVVSFHSLEDARVKQFFRTLSGMAPAPSRHLPFAAAEKQDPPLKLLGRDQKAGDAETAANPRARSARLRAAERTAAPLPDPLPASHMLFGGRHA